MSKFVARKIQEHDIDSCKKWLCDNTPINVQQGLDDILSNNNPLSLLKKMQIRHLGSKLAGNMMFARSSITVEDGVVTLDDIVTILANFNHPGMLGSSIRSRPQFVKLIYQYMSCFPVALSQAYKEITGENLILDDLSEVREFYESCSAFDSWTGHELCAYISHCDPEALDFISEHPEALDFMSEDPKGQNFMLNKVERLLPSRFSRIFLRPDLYEKNLTLVKAAIFGKALPLLHGDPNNWLDSYVDPYVALQWAKEKRIGYHALLEELIKRRGEEISSTAPTPLQSENWQEKVQAVAKKRISEQLDMTWEDAVKDQEIKEAAKYMSKGVCVDRSEYKLREALGPVFNPNRKKGRPKGRQ